jgi:hypothetical protein
MAATAFRHKGGEHAEGRISMYVQAREGEPFEELYRRFKRGIWPPARVSTQATVHPGP